MGNIWFTSDTHFSHAKFLTWEKEDGHPARPFGSVEEMDETIIERWNAVVRPGDKVYHMGDVAFDRHRLPGIMERLTGAKRLTLGNHDDIKRYGLATYFAKIQLWRVWKEQNFVCSHVPLSPDHFPANVGFNIHGHTHHQVLKDPRYINVCVEPRDYRPVHMDTILAEIAAAC